jgi:short-subunit dehydrogenase
VQGVNLALAARSTDQLRAVAEDLAHLGVRAVAVPADITNEASRRALIERAEAELGQIDILVNNAGIAQWVRFAQQKQDDILGIVELNLLAPLLLTRLLLPSMLRRGQGHIATISSLAGKKGLGYEATYAASKAGLIEWTSGLRLELEGTGVSASAICPIYLRDTGGFAAHGHRAPRLAGSVAADDVAQAVVRAIRQDIPEVLVRRSPTRPLLVLNALSPRLGSWIVKRMGAIDLNRRMADELPRPAEAEQAAE